MSVGIKNGAINFESDSAVFYPGQVISGKFTFDLDETLNLSVIYIQYNGQAEVLWTETERQMVNGSVTVKDIEYIGRENYFDYVENVVGGTAMAQLQRGSHVFPFSYQLPFSLPSTFHGTVGDIKYNVTAVVIYAYPRTGKEEIIKEFEVVVPFDLNTFDLCKKPIEFTFDNVYGGNCFCEAKPLAVKVTLPVSGYTPGQTIPIEIEVDNQSNVEITKMVFQVVKQEYFRSQQPESEYMPSDEKISEAKRGAVLGKSRRTVSCGLLLPEIVMPDLENCDIINVRYFFKLRIKLSGWHSDFVGSSEIYMGLLPLKEFATGDCMQQLAYCLPNGPIPKDPNQPPNSIEPAEIGFNQFNPGYPSNSSESLRNATDNIPVRGYEIGFKLPGAGDAIPSGVPPYPAVNGLPQNQSIPPYMDRDYTPSAPPLS